MISLINHDSSEGEQWGRYNLPRLNIWEVQFIPMDLQKYVPQEFVFNGHIQMIMYEKTDSLPWSKNKGPTADKGPLSKNRD